MKVSHLFAALALAFTGAAFAADKHADGHEIKPMHGGAVAEAKDIDYELVTKADKLQLYMRDHGKPLDPAGMSAKVTLLSGSEKQEAQLLPVLLRLRRHRPRPARPHGLEARGRGRRIRGGR